MISREVTKFLAENIDSAELLDVLLAIHHEPERDWTPDAVSQRIFSVPQSAQRRLKELEARGLAKPSSRQPGAYVLDTSDPARMTILDQLKAEYQQSRAEVIGIVFANKSDPIQSFSNAFKLRSD